MKNIAFDTLNALDLFGINNQDENTDDETEELNKDTVILHIPHSSKHIPSLAGYVLPEDKLKSEIDLLTDHFTDEIFNFKNVSRLVTPFNRIFCDVERLPDEQEKMFKHGRGFYYTKTDSGENLRIIDEENKSFIFKEYYLKHHENLNLLVQDKLNKFGQVTIIDCHSFLPIPFQSDLNQDPDRPNICLGIDDFHTPIFLIKKIKSGFEKEGLTVKINNPYSGTIIPMKYYNKNNNVRGIMIEINRSLYMHMGIVINHNVQLLNKIIENILF
ncbi:MAG: N-formylglutamate amidohydrolase [bacterium]